MATPFALQRTMCHAIPGRCDTPSGPNDQDHLSIDLLYETASATPPVFAGLVHRRELLMPDCINRLPEECAPTGRNAQARMRSGVAAWPRRGTTRNGKLPGVPAVPGSTAGCASFAPSGCFASGP